MKVLMLSSLWPPEVLGGAELYASRLAAELRDLGHEVGAVTLGVRGHDVVATVAPWPYGLQDFHAQPAWKRALFHARDVYDPRAGHAVRDAIARFAPDVVHSHAVSGLSTAALSAPAARGTAHVHTLHDYWLLCQRTSMVTADGSLCERRCAGCVAVSAVRDRVLRRHFADVVIAPSHALAEEHARWSWLAPRVEVLAHPGERAGPPPRRTGPHTPFAFGFIGQLSAVKGVPTLLRAFRSLGGTRLLVAGRGACDDDVAAAGPGVTAVGWVEGEDRERFFASIDCLVVPSEWKEAAGLVAIEAADRGIPVVAADIGGLPEYVDAASRPLLFRSGDVDDLARAMRHATDQWRAFLPASVPARQTWADHARALVGIYERAP